MADTFLERTVVVWDRANNRLFVFDRESETMVRFEEAAGISDPGPAYYRLKRITRVYEDTALALDSDTAAIRIKGVAAGGGGGGAEGGSNNGAAGGGGAGGAHFDAWKEEVAGQTLTCQVGDGGPAGTPGNDGGTGGDTSVTNGDWALSAEGGTGGQGQSSGDWAQSVPGGFGRNASGGDLNVGGEPGNPGLRLDFQNNMPGRGGSSPFGAGGQAFAGNSDGQQGLGHGAGGGGGAVADSGTGRSGGAGSAGYIEIWEYA